MKRKAVNKGIALDERYNLDEVFDKPYADTDEERYWASCKDIKGIRLKTTISGNFIESDCYPIWHTRASARRAPKAKKSRDAQRKLNNKNAVRSVVRLINTNFTEEDVWATFTYDELHLPATPQAANAFMHNYLRRVKRAAKKRGYGELKYLFVTEFCEDAKKGKTRIHHHLVVNFPCRDTLEDLWQGGARTHARRLQPDEFGYEGLARYITKDPNGTRRYTASKNLVRPTVIIADHRMTRGKVDKLVRGTIDAKEEYERIYKGFEFTDLKAFQSDYVSGNYVYVRMRKKE